MSSSKSKTDSKTYDKPKTKSTPPMRIFDVARPGTLPPADATARPVIVTNRAVMQDPMMVPRTPSDVDDKGNDTQDFSKLSNKLVVKPLAGQNDDIDDPTITKSGDEDVSDQPVDESSDADSVADNDNNKKNDYKATTSDASSDEPAESDKLAEKSQADSTVSKPDADPETKPKIDSETKPKADTEDEDAEAPSPQTALDKEAAQLEVDAKAQDEIDTLVDQKTYFLPINSVEKRRSKHVFIFGILIIVILAAAWLDIAMDAGFIDVPGLKPLTHLFRN